MKKSVKLPLYDEFLEVFDNHEIQNWQAKHFWERMVLTQSRRNERYKQLMYRGLKVLLKCNYLEIDKTQSTLNKFIYKETPHLNELRNKHKKQKLEKVFLIKKSEFLDQIKVKENNIEFLDQLLSHDKTLEKYFIIHKEKIEKDIKNINSNIKLMEDILSS